jgi:hypothetical protein
VVCFIFIFAPVDDDEEEVVVAGPDLDVNLATDSVAGEYELYDITFVFLIPARALALDFRTFGIKILMVSFASFARDFLLRNTVCDEAPGPELVDVSIVGVAIVL